MRRNALLIVFFLTYVLLINGCSAARKPQDFTPPQKQILVPQVSTISFDTVEIKNTPKIVQDVAKDIAGKDFATWLKVNNSAYILVSQSSKTSSFQVEIAEILQKLPSENYIWYQVTLDYKPSDGLQNAYSNEPLAAKFTLPPAQTISGVGFDFEKMRIDAPQTGGNTGERPSPHSVAERQTSLGAGLLLDVSNPAPNQELTAPFKVTGKLESNLRNNKGEVIVRLRDNAGQIIVEKPVGNVSDLQGKDFEAVISYPVPQSPEKAAVEVLIFDRESGAERSTVRVPVVLK